MTTKNNSNTKLSAEEIAELRSMVDAGIRSVSNTNLEEMERVSGHLTHSEILFFATIGSRKMREEREKQAC